MNDPADASNIELLRQSSILNNSNPIYCAASFATLNAAKNGDCSDGQWVTTPPSDLDENQNFYFVLIKSQINGKSLTGMFDEGATLEDAMPLNLARNVVKIGGAGEQAASACNQEALRNRSCYIPIESAEARLIETTVQRERGNGDNYTQRAHTSAELSSSRELEVGAPVCMDREWSCDGFEEEIHSRFPDYDNKRQGTIWTWTSAPSRNGTVQRSMRRVASAPLLVGSAGELPNNYRPCNDSGVGYFTTGDGRNSYNGAAASIDPLGSQLTNSGLRCWGGQR